MVVLPLEGRPALLNWCLSSVDPEYKDLKLLLFKNDLTPSINTTLLDLEPATFDGYAPVQWPSNDNVDAAVIGANAYIRLGNRAFVFDVTDNPHTVYGWGVASAAEEVLMFVERFDEPKALVVGSRVTLYLDVKL